MPASFRHLRTALLAAKPDSGWCFWGHFLADKAASRSRCDVAGAGWMPVEEQAALCLEGPNCLEDSSRLLAEPVSEKGTVFGVNTSTLLTLATDARPPTTFEPQAPIHWFPART